MPSSGEVVAAAAGSRATWASMSRAAGRCRISAGAMRRPRTRTRAGVDRVVGLEVGAGGVDQVRGAVLDGQPPPPVPRGHLLVPGDRLRRVAQLHRGGDPRQLDRRRPEPGPVMVVPVAHPGGQLGGLVEQVDRPPGRRRPGPRPGRPAPAAIPHNDNSSGGHHRSPAGRSGTRRPASPTSPPRPRRRAQHLTELHRRGGHQHPVSGGGGHRPVSGQPGQAPPHPASPATPPSPGTPPPAPPGPPPGSCAWVRCASINTCGSRSTNRG